MDQKETSQSLRMHEMWTNSPLTAEQRAFVVGEEGLCPECERELKWSAMNAVWYMCQKCVDEIVNGEPYVGEGQRTESPAGPKTSRMG